MANKETARSENQLEDVVQGNQQANLGTEGPRHRAAPGEGVRAPFIKDGADHAEFSIFDGKGNESVVVVADGADGRVVEGTGPDSAAAMADAKRSGETLGKDFGPVTGE